MRVTLVFPFLLVLLFSCVQNPATTRTVPAIMGNPTSVNMSTHKGVGTSTQEPAVKTTDPTPYQKQYIVSVKDESTSIVESALWNMAIYNAVLDWNYAFGYEILIMENGFVNLYINIIPTEKVGVAGNCRKLNCTQFDINLYKSRCDKRAVALHEIGHAFGLKHSDNIDDIMYFQAPLKVKLLTDNDIKLAKKSVQANCEWTWD